MKVSLIDITLNSETQLEACCTDLVLWETGQRASDSIEWPLGDIYCLPPVPADASRGILELMANSNAKYVLFWDQRLGQPDYELIKTLVQEAVDIWHAGLSLGTSGEPADLDYKLPAWMFNRDPDPMSRAISWRLSLNACLVRTNVLTVLGQIDPAFETITMAGLEMGYRFLWRGAVPVNEPRLVEGRELVVSQRISTRDRYVFFARHFPSMWCRYILMRRILSNGAVYREVQAYRVADRVVRMIPPTGQPGASLTRPQSDMPDNVEQPKISVLIPTLCRYPYLKDTLRMLEEQTIKPLEVICVDQTPLPERQPGVYESFGGLNIKVMWRDTPGVCSARNAGLQKIQGDYILFLDDDVKVSTDYIESLFEALRLYDADIAVGVWSQGEAEARYKADRIHRVSDRLAGGNSLAKRTVILESGGFDLHYDRDYREDADLGMRLYLAGAISIIAPRATEYSISPPTGGFKSFGAFDGIRKIGLLRPWPAVTQTYYWLRYFSKRQVRESFLLAFVIASVPREVTYSASTIKKLGFMLARIWVFPVRMWGMWLSRRSARRMLSIGPQIPGICSES